MTLTACDLCRHSLRFESAEIEKALDEHYEKFPDSDWDYWDEVYFREVHYCGGCPDLYGEESEVSDG